jgi:hypothetical protein
MILVDNSQLLIASIFQNMKSNSTMNTDFIRHLVFNSYRFINKKFGNKYGNIVVCNDSGHSWRKTIFPQYKQNRKRKQDTSGLNWTEIYENMSIVRSEILEVLPYKNIKINNAEADDIIAVLAKHYHKSEPILIVSNDNDFQQLQIYPKVEQYSIIKKDFIKCESPKQYLTDHILEGDSGDGIPNILSDSDTFVTEGKRQNRLTRQKRKEITDNLGSITGTEWIDNWNRNKTLIDLSEIPNEIENQILEAYSKPVQTKISLLDYMISHKLNNLLESVGDF